MFGDNGLVFTRCNLVIVPWSLDCILQGHKDSIEALVADGLFLLSGGCDGAVRVWDISILEHEGASEFRSFRSFST